MTLKYKPQIIYIENHSDDNQYAKDILNRLKDIPVVYIDEFNEKTIKEFHSVEDNITIGKRILLLRKFKGSFLKKCPGTKHFLCCNYYVINAQTNCPFDCTYCSLQNYLNTQAMVIFTNIEDILFELNTVLNDNPNRFFRIGTGELADSLALDHITHLSKILVEFFAEKQNAVLELKTKSNNIDNLLTLNQKGNTVISFSLNPQIVIDSDEKDTASLIERLTAAKKTQEAGYKSAFHFDPLVLIDNYKIHYAELIKQLFDFIKPENIKWISMGGFRYPKEIYTAIKERFPYTRMILQEFLQCDDNKWRYLKHKRVELYLFIKSEMEKYHKKAPLYMCMESKDIWDEVFGYRPHINENTKQLFDFKFNE